MNHHSDHELETNFTPTGLTPARGLGAPLKILLVEDSVFDRRLLMRSLKDWPFDLILAEDGEQAWQMLEHPNAPRLVLLDWVLPGMDGLEICQRIRKRPSSGPYTYILMLSARDEKQDLVAAMAAGADDFLVKPFDEGELKARLLAGKRILDLQEQLVAAREALRFAAVHDPLTGLWNRAEILAFVRKEMARSRRESRPLGILMADLDHFKSINDTFGHLVGDNILKQTARTLSENLRPYDGCGRYGGEEFLIALPGCDFETTVRRANEIRMSFSNLPISDSSETSISISIGATAGLFPEAIEVQSLLQYVDGALYQAKRLGRNRVEPVTVPGALEVKITSTQASLSRLDEEQNQ